MQSTLRYISKDIVKETCGIVERNICTKCGRNLPWLVWDCPHCNITSAVETEGKMGNSEDVAAERYFTPPTLTAMLRGNLNMDPESDAEAQATKDTVIAIKSTFKEWLRTVGLPQQMSEESTRHLLITLVDEP